MGELGEVKRNEGKKVKTAPAVAWTKPSPEGRTDGAVALVDGQIRFVEPEDLEKEIASPGRVVRVDGPVVDKTGFAVENPVYLWPEGGAISRLNMSAAEIRDALASLAAEEEPKPLIVDAADA
jgi:hypothetical protein